MVYVVNRGFSSDAEDLFDKRDRLGVDSPDKIISSLGGVTVLGLMETPTKKQLLESLENKNITQN